MSTRKLNRTVTYSTAAALVAALATWTPATPSAIAASADGCGVTVLPSLDPSGAHPGGELLDLTHDGIYVGSSQDSAGIQRATYWVDEVPHRVPVDLEDGWIGDVNQQHVTVGSGWDPDAERYVGYVFDLDTEELTWLPGIGGDTWDARRINEHGVAVGGGSSSNGTFHPLRWSPPYTEVDRLPKVGGSHHGDGAWAAGNNDAGQIVGSTVRGRITPDRRDYGGFPAKFHFIDLDAIKWSPGPHGLEEAGPYSHSWDINNAGTAVGFADFDSLQTTAAAYWTADGQLHQMGSVVPGMWQSLALGVSEGGWAAGSVDLDAAEDEDPRHAFVWTGSGNLLMLPTLDGAWDASASNAHGVDDQRDEVAGQLTVDGRSRAAVWRCASVVGVDPT